MIKTGELHGHFCPGVSLGVRAAVIALRQLDVLHNTGMEEIVAIVEGNNCFADGVQMVTGCSFANNALIYRDLGKTALTLSRRDGDAVRVSVRPDWGENSRERFPEAHALFEKIVTNREPATEAEQARLDELWLQRSFGQLEMPEDQVYRVEHLQIKVPEYAPIHGSVHCQVCGESVMETKARFQDGEPICLACAGRQHYQLDGAGISVRESEAS
jgi:formylmethanofuran dehydrogenase subunit E